MHNLAQVIDLTSNNLDINDKLITSEVRSQHV